jgi:hypothetical protein
MRIESRPLASGEVDHELVWSSIGTVSLVCAGLALSTVGPPPVICTFHAITGLPCPTCGGTRALLALLDGQVFQAVAWNPMVALTVVAFPVYAAYGAWVTALNRRRVRLSLTSRERTLARAAAGVLILASWIFLIAVGR